VSRRVASCNARPVPDGIPRTEARELLARAHDVRVLAPIQQTSLA
jgi:hypothetical protein